MQIDWKESIPFVLSDTGEIIELNILVGVLGYSRYKMYKVSFLKTRTVLMPLLEDGNLVLSNNLAERAIKSLVIGRKNWLFSQSFEGAQSSAIIMTLLETAKQNGLDSEKYINYLLMNLPNEDTLEKNGILETYLPWNENIKETCR